MYIRNFSNEDLLLDNNGTSILLVKEATTLVPDGVVTSTELAEMFGTRVQVVSTGPSSVLMTNQQEVQAGKLYTTEPLTNYFEHIRVYISGSTCSVYGSDNSVIPTALSDMALPTENVDMSGCLSVGNLPHFIAFKNTGDSTPKIIVTNCKLHEVSSIS